MFNSLITGIGVVHPVESIQQFIYISLLI